MPLIQKSPKTQTAYPVRESMYEYYVVSVTMTPSDFNMVSQLHPSDFTHRNFS